MKYFLLSVFLFFTPFAFSQEGAEPVQNAEASGQTPSAAAEAQTLPAEPSLEEFLKRQEELWLQEKNSPEPAAESSDGVVLPPPSVLTEELSAPAEEQKTAKPAAEIQKAKRAAASTKKERVSSPVENPSPVLNAEIKTRPEQTLAEEAPAQEKNNWPALLKGLVFALLLGAAVWLLSKYQ